MLNIGKIWNSRGIDYWEMKHLDKGERGKQILLIIRYRHKLL